MGIVGLVGCAADPGPEATSGEGSNSATGEASAGTTSSPSSSSGSDATGNGSSPGESSDSGESGDSTTAGPTQCAAGDEEAPTFEIDPDEPGAWEIRVDCEVAATEAGHISLACDLGDTQEVFDIDWQSDAFDVPADLATPGTVVDFEAASDAFETWFAIRATGGLRLAGFLGGVPSPSGREDDEVFRPVYVDPGSPDCPTMPGSCSTETRATSLLFTHVDDVREVFATSVVSVGGYTVHTGELVESVTPPRMCDPGGDDRYVYLIAYAD
jgi:hypothetical protein